MNKAAGISLTPWEVDPYKLISWWDMEEFLGSEFNELCDLLAGISRSTEILCQLGKDTPDATRDKKLVEIDERALSVLVSNLTYAENICNKIGLYDSTEAVNEFRSDAIASKGNISFGEVGARVFELQRAMQREMKRHLFLHIPIARANYYQSWGESKRKERGEEGPLFGSAVDLKFPSTQFDIAESGNSFATGRFTACVFHLMRVLEMGLRAMAQVFGINADHSNWHNAIEQIQNRIEEIGKGRNKPANWTKDDQEFYAQAASHFFILKDAWRNYTAHVRGKYTEEEANRIMGNTRFFMQKLSERLSE
jgi:hypothetical protein